MSLSAKEIAYNAVYALVLNRLLDKSKMAVFEKIIIVSVLVRKCSVITQATPGGKLLRLQNSYLSVSQRYKKKSVTQHRPMMLIGIYAFLYRNSSNDWPSRENCPMEMTLC